ncbi:MAG: tryptophan--tRNA ligase [Bacteroidales bacterium]|nr:tryptophan--tRNA ligase [Bacteroidales bacterium]MBQ2483107.1 tryptophan--tRNA ligase [Bacteroidales bacterium]MBQ2492956.1 tryptophan--tRNA ligase [Bacteroidales bacterium]MBQ4196563.1 tryptophan--tRNA ligase [Bacteroidales bacterium]
MSSKVILTGDRPTGRLHIGHYVGSLRGRVEIQNAMDYKDMFVFIADAQALTDNFDNPEKVRQNIIEVALDYLSVGLDPNKITIFVQSMIPELTELAFYYMNLVTVARLQRNPTVKSEIQMRGFSKADRAEGKEQGTGSMKQGVVNPVQKQDASEGSAGHGEDNQPVFGSGLPVGFFTYPISQAADITAFKATTVPAGEDQKPMIEQTVEIVRKFNSIYGQTLVEPDILLPSNSACLRLPGTDGKAKMSKSLGNCIYLSESAEEVNKKVMGMYTDPLHISINDPGHIEGNTVFTYLDAFCRQEHFGLYLPEYASLDELKAHYQRGGLGDVKIKKFLGKILNQELEPIRERRKEFEKDIPEVYNMLQKGSRKAREVAASTMDDVRRAMKINYFEDKQLIAEQAERFKQQKH